MKIMTKEYLDHVFILPLSNDKREYIRVKPLTVTMRNRIRNAAIQEAGQDQNLMVEYIVRDTLKECIQDWHGVQDANGIEIPYNTDNLLELIPLDTLFFEGLYTRIVSVARFGELEEVKN